MPSTREYWSRAASHNAQEPRIKAELDAFRTALEQSWQDVAERVRQALACIHAHLFDEKSKYLKAPATSSRSSVTR